VPVSSRLTAAQVARRNTSGRLGGRRPHRRRRAFTLIELLAVLVIAGLLMAIGFAKLRDAVERAKEVKAISDLKAMSVALNEAETLPTSLAAIGWGGRLDPWGRPYVYAPFPPPKGKGNAPPAGARKDRFLVPINSRYDLYSVGKDGGSAAPLTAKASRDDIIVANDGGFIGRASKF
jgi:general secretion pathway protein G